MRKIGMIIFATFSILMHFQAAAQGGQGQTRKQEHFDRGAFETKRNAYITAELELTPEDAAKDAEYTRAIEICLDAYLKEAELEKAYYERFKKILSPKKLYRLDQAESKFMRSYMREERGQEKRTD